MDAVGLPGTVSTVLSGVEAIVTGPGGRDPKLMTICELLHDRFDDYDWVGFYLVDPDGERMLVLGPYVGDPTEHVRIPFGRGICGQAAERGETFVVPDVLQEMDYLSCSPKVRSEIVVPIRADGRMVGELDIDSHEADAFPPHHRRLLEDACSIISSLFTE